MPKALCLFFAELLWQYITNTEIGTQKTCKICGTDLGTKVTVLVTEADKYVNK